MKLKKILLALVITVFVTLLSTGCLVVIEDGNADIEGSWEGYFMYYDGGMVIDDMTASFYQDGDEVDGEVIIWLDGDPQTYDVFFEIDGDDIDGVLDAQNPLEAYDIEVELNVNNDEDEISGDFYVPSTGLEGTIELEKW
ncbi:MAG: hypothetical protein JXB88_21460 [Spirochaetales bacterium]|nr:hypothetical protein [Spirochaetales bacterium]